MDPFERVVRALSGDFCSMDPDGVPRDFDFIDLSVFEDDGKKAHDCNVHGAIDMVNSCPSLKRLTVSLKYYETLRFIGRRESKNGLTIFADFIEKVYGQFLDDLSHLKRDHLCDLGLIQRNLMVNEGFTECDGIRCCGTARSDSKTASSKSKTATEDAFVSLIGRSYEALHLYLVHPFGRTIRGSLVLNKAENTTLHEMVGGQIGHRLFECSLLYRGSEHGFGYDAFWSRSEGAARCLVVIQTTANRVFGGFTAVGFKQHLNPSNSTWTSGPRGQGAADDKDAFIFSLRFLCDSA